MLSPRPESTPHRRQPRAPNSTQFAPWLFHAKCQINTLINPRLGNIVTAHRKHCPRETTSRSVASIVVACRGPTAAVSLFLGNTTHGTLAREGFVCTPQTILCPYGEGITRYQGGIQSRGVVNRGIRSCRGPWSMQGSSVLPLNCSSPADYRM